MIQNVIGNVDYLNRTGVGGWAAIADHPKEMLGVEIAVNGKVVKHILASEMREDLWHLFPDGNIYHGFNFQFDRPLSVYFDQTVEVRTIDTQELITNGNQTFSAHELLPLTGFTPLLVTSTGRSGSSILMASLRQTGKLLVGGRHPYEVRMVSYFGHAIRVLTTGADHKRSTHPDFTSGDADPFYLGLNPFQHAQYGTETSISYHWQKSMPHLTIQWARDAIQGYYEAVSAAQGTRMPSHFVEKSFPDRVGRVAAMTMFGRCREIVLLRDPRDLVCSYRAFWNLPIEIAIKRVSGEMSRLLRVVNSDDPPDLVIRYEDLVHEHCAVMESIATKLNFEQESTVVQNTETSVPTLHLTSMGPAESINRWKNDLRSDEIRACEIAFCDILSKYFALGAV